MRILIRHFAILAFATLALAACGQNASSPITNTTQAKGYQTVKPAILQKQSPHSFAVTEGKIREAIAARPLNLFAEVPHSKGAAKAGLELAPSTLFIFGNPKGGTPLMARNPEMGMELPLKIHVFEKDGVVMVNYTDIAAVVESYGADATTLSTPTIAAMLEGLVGSVVAQE